MFLKTSAYVKHYVGETKLMHLFNKDDELLQKYNGIWNKVSNSIKEKVMKLHIFAIKKQLQ